MWSNEKIMRRTKRTLKRMNCYLESRDASRLLGYTYELDFVLTKTDTAVAYAHFGDEVIKFNPFKKDVTAQSLSDWSFSLDSDLFFYLESGFELAEISPGVHYAAWMEISECHKDGINYLIGMQRYLHYCKQNGLTRDYLREKFQYDGLDAMVLYDKSALKKNPF